MAVNPEIVEYIKTQLKAGYSIDDIKEALKGQGWSEEDINDCVKAAQEEKPEEKKPEEAKPAEAAKVPGVLGKKTTITFSLALAAGVMVLTEVALDAIMPIFSGLISALKIIPLTGFLLTVINVVFGAGIIVGCVFMLMPGNEKIGSILVILLSVVYLLSGGFLVAAMLGIIGGVLGFLKK